MRAAPAILLALAACSAPPPVAPAPPRKAPPAIEIPMSDPAEYAIERISRDAGEQIFARTGIGDPYRTGVPYPIFLALLRGYPKLFGATTTELAARFGFVPRAADPDSKDLDVREGLPVGMHITIDPITNVPFVVTSCALCHAERVGKDVVVGLANKRVRIHAYDAAFADVVPLLSAEKLRRLADDAAAARGVAWPDVYRDLFVVAAIDTLRTRAKDRGELIARTRDALPGRVATIEAFVPVLAQLAHRSIEHASVVGWAKVPDVIGFGQRTSLSWDGSGEGSMDLLAVEADVAAGVRVAWLERHPFQGASLGAYLRQPASRPHFPGELSSRLVARGKELFGEKCARCHGSYDDAGRARDYEEQIVPIEDVGTDPARMMAATASFERAANDPELTRGYTRFRRSNGYVPPILTNVWARAPYGHVGQWPSLAALATPPAERAARFVVAANAPYDLAAVGVATRAIGGELAAGEYVYDASRPGLSNAGHPFLADLGREDARAVIEYLKSL